MKEVEIKHSIYSKEALSAHSKSSTAAIFHFTE